METMLRCGELYSCYRSTQENCSILISCLAVMTGQRSFKRISVGPTSHLLLRCFAIAEMMPRGTLGFLIGPESLDRLKLIELCQSNNINLLVGLKST